MSKKLPQRLVDKQESERTATTTAITNAIIELESQGYNIKIKDIMFVTGLSRSVFAKPHIRKVLVEYGIVEPKKIESSTVSDGKNRNLDMILAEKDGYIQRLIFANEQLTHEIEVLRGKVHLLMHKSAAEEDDELF